MTRDIFDETLMAEFESSGLSIDEFIEQKLKANGRPMLVFLHVSRHKRKR